MERSAHKRTLIVLPSLILGGFLGIGAAFAAAFFDNAEEDAEDQEKLQEICEALISQNLLERTKKSLRVD